MRSLPCVLFLAPLLSLAACGGGGGRVSTVGNQDGESSIVFTDAPSDELSMFEVDVSNIVLKRLSGDSVSVLAKRTTVNFAELADVGDLIVGAGLVGGFYTGMTMTLDFSSATVLINGSTKPAKVLDTNGAEINGSVAVTVSFHNEDRPFVRANRHHLFQLDLDLDQAITVDSGNNTVTFTPILSASFDPDQPKPVWRTGLLNSVDPAASSFTIQKRGSDETAIGTYTVKVGNSTVYQVDGVGYGGAAGLTALAALANGARVHVEGTLDKSTRTLNATWVEAGLGVVGNGQDWIEGLITARTGGPGANATLTVLGQSRRGERGARAFNTSHTVSVAYATTRVLRRGASNSFNTDDLEVGQRVLAFGTLSGTTLDASSAAGGIVRELPTHVSGIANGPVASNVLTMNASRVGLRPITDFNFTVSNVVQLNPAAFTVATTGLATGAIANGSKVRATGWMRRVGTTTGQDLTSVGLLDRSRTHGVLTCTWSRANAKAFASIAATGIGIDVSAADKKQIDNGFDKLTLTVSPTPMLKPADTFGVYRILRKHDDIEVHTRFATFASALQAQLDDGARVSRVGALVESSGGAQIYNVSGIAVRLE